MTEKTYSQDDILELAKFYSSRLLLARPVEKYLALFEAIRVERQRRERNFGEAYVEHIEGSPAQWIKWANQFGSHDKSLLGGDPIARVTPDLFAEIERDICEAKYQDMQRKAPEGVPTGHLRRAISDDGLNIGVYTFRSNDTHYWLPPEEASKERPDLSKGISESVLRKKAEEELLEMFQRDMSASE